MGILRRTMWFVLLIFVILATAAMVRWPVRQLPDLWRFVWLFSAALTVASCLASFLLAIRAMRLQMANKTLALEENERFLVTLLGNLPGMAYRRADDRDGSMEIVSEGGFALTGYRPEEMERFRDIVHPDDVSTVFPAEGGENSPGRSFCRQYRLRTKAGSEKWVLEQGVGVPGADGKSMFCEGFLLDITEAKKKEEELLIHQDHLEELVRERTAELAEAKEKAEETCRAFRLQHDFLHTLVETIPSPLFYKDSEGRYTGCNGAFERYLGKPRSEIIGKTVFDMAAPDIAARYHEEDQKLLDHPGIQHYTWKVPRVDGVLRDVIFDKASILGGDGKAAGILGIITDVTELEAARKQAETTSKNKSDFLASIGHEIRTPLNSILGFSQILQAQLGEERLQQYIQAITASGKTLLRLINDLLDLSKIEAGKFELQPSAVDLQRVAREIQLVFMPSVDEKQLKFVVDLDPNLPGTVFLDEVRLRQILVNLLRNAFKFTDKGRISLSLRVVGTAQSGAVDLEIAVADTGMGVPPEDQETIFEAFIQQRRQDQAKYAGTGLGLSITRRLVETLGGRISLHSEVGKGSTFTALLRGIPVAEDYFNRSQQDNGGRDILFDEEAVVLVVDAMDSDRLLIREFLRSTKLAIVETISIADGVEWCMAIKPDLILLDYTLSLVPDPLLVQRFNRVKEDLNIPIVVMTSVMGVGSDDFYTDYRFDGWLGKPLLFEDVMRMLARFLPHATLGRDDDTLAVDRREEYILPSVAEVRQAVAGLNGRLPALRRILAGKKLAQWREIQETCIINEMKTFAEEVEQMSAEYNLGFLAGWAKILLSRIRLFDMERVPETFHLFADLVDMIEECSRPGAAAEEFPCPPT